MNRTWGADTIGRKRGESYACPHPAVVKARLAAMEPQPDLEQDGRHGRLAAELAPMVQVWERLLAQHLPDDNGRCRTCTQGGTGLPGTPWPCALHGIATLAQRRHDRAQEA
jgi:hypothetical protein